MSAPPLIDQAAAASKFASALESDPNRIWDRTRSRAVARLEVQEEASFKEGQWLPIADVVLRPSRPESEEERRDRGAETEAFRQAVLNGRYELVMLDYEAIANAIKPLLKSKEGDSGTAADAKMGRALDAVAACIVRAGLAHPVFDPFAFAEMPFSRPATLVVDTCAVLQGGLDFAARYLTPMVRFKVPAIVHMEIMNQAQNYFSYRRSGKPAGLNALRERAGGIGGQHVLQRLESCPNAHVERPRIGPDPLRGIVTLSSDSQDKGLNIQVIARSYADRLIFETALQHQERMTPDHSVMLLTSDEALARMALAEGVSPLFFRAVKLQTLSKARLPGVPFQPFPGKDGAKFDCVPLSSLIWELAATFGAARLRQERSNSWVAIYSIGGDWQPFHTRLNLFRFEISPQDFADVPLADSASTATAFTDALTRPSMTAAVEPHAPQYRFSVESLLALVDALNDRPLAAPESRELLGLQNPKRLQEYNRFLQAGEFAEMIDGRLCLTETGRKMRAAIHDRNREALGACWDRVPSFREFCSWLTLGQPLTKDDPRVVESAFRNYSVMADLAGRGFSIAQEGVYGTFRHPTVEEFADLALASYHQLAADGDFILTGDWLLGLAKTEGIHPVRSRIMAERAISQGLLDWRLEGSTPETRFDHRVFEIAVNEGKAILQSKLLYDGAFLTPGRSSVIIKLSRPRS